MTLKSACFCQRESWGQILSTYSCSSQSAKRPWYSGPSRSALRRLRFYRSSHRRVRSRASERGPINEHSPRHRSPALLAGVRPVQIVVPKILSSTADRNHRNRHPRSTPCSLDRSRLSGTSHFSRGGKYLQHCRSQPKARESPTYDHRRIGVSVLQSRLSSRIQRLSR
jgi:hypothetical protein